MSGNKFIINQNGEIEDTMAHITFDSFMEILIVLNGQSRHLKKLSEENERLKQSYQLLADMCDEYKELKDSLENENEWLKKENKEIRQDNDIKFWKLQCMHYFNSNSLFMSEISRAIKKGYEVSDKFQEYVDELKENNKEIKEKNKRLFGDSE